MIQCYHHASLIRVWLTCALSISRPLPGLWPPLLSYNHRRNGYSHVGNRGDRSGDRSDSAGTDSGGGNSRGDDCRSGQAYKAVEVHVEGWTSVHIDIENVGDLCIGVLDIGITKVAPPDTSSAASRRRAGGVDTVKDSDRECIFYRGGSASVFEAFLAEGGEEGGGEVRPAAAQIGGTNNAAMAATLGSMQIRARCDEANESSLLPMKPGHGRRITLEVFGGSIAGSQRGLLSVRYASSTGSEHGRCVEQELEFRTLPSLRVVSLDVLPLGCTTPRAVDTVARARAWTRHEQCGPGQDGGAGGATEVATGSCTKECQFELEVENDSCESMEVFCTTSEEALKRVWDVEGGGSDAAGTSAGVGSDWGHNPRVAFADSPSRQRLSTPRRGGVRVGGGGGETAFSADSTVHRFVLDGNMRRRFPMCVPRLADADVAAMRGGQQQRREQQRGAAEEKMRSVGGKEGEEGEEGGYQREDEDKALLSRVIHLCWIQPRTGISGRTKIDPGAVSQRAVHEFMPAPVDIQISFDIVESDAAAAGEGGRGEGRGEGLNDGLSLHGIHQDVGREARILPGAFATVRVVVTNTSPVHLPGGGVVQVWPYEDRAGREAAAEGGRNGQGSEDTDTTDTTDTTVAVLARSPSGEGTNIDDRLVISGALEVRTLRVCFLTMVQLYECRALMIR